MKRFVCALALAGFCLAAFADGDLDPGFGTAGIAQTGVSNAGGYVRGLAAQADGKIVICDRGNLSAPSADDFYVARFNTDGSLDASFGLGGKTFVDFGGSDYCNAVAVQSDGKLVLAGSTGNTSTGAVMFAIARLNSDGTPDSTFGSANGQVTISFSSAGTVAGAWALAIQNTGTIVVVGQAGPSVAIAQLLPNGTLDPSFGVNGQSINHFALNGGGVQGRAVAIDSQSRIVIVAAGAGSDGYEFFQITRLLTDGSTDMSFGVEGFTQVSFDYGGLNDATATAMAIQSDDRVVVAGVADTSTTVSAQDEEYAVVRLLTNGTLDPGFGTQGKAVIPFSGPNNYARSVAIQTNGLIVLAGSALPSSGGSVPTATRLNTDGSVDTNFGLRTYNLGTASSGIFSMIVDDLDIYAAGFLPVTGGNDDFVIKLTNDQVFGNGFN